MIKHCYVHIPFCDNICSYCDFSKMLYQEEMVNSYLEALEKEIKSIYQNDELETIYIGGGTPSCLNLTQLEKLFKILSIFKKKYDLEYTIEGNFETTTEEKLRLYKQYGINRLSFGVESIHKKNLQYLGRIFNKEMAEQVLKNARKMGFDNINLDLMYALPTETTQMVFEDIDYLISLNPEHISTYSLIIENNTKLKIQGEKSISEELDDEMYRLITNELKNNYYNHYEISNFSKNGFESRHNLCYWNNREYYGFGLGASSYLNHKRITNTRSFNQYIHSNWGKDVEYLEEKDIIEYEVILNLRTKKGINLESFKKKYKKDLSEIYHYEKIVDDGYLQLEKNYLFIPENKWYISNAIIVRLLGSEDNG